MVCDAHNHLQDEWLAPHLERIAADLEGIGIRGMVVNGTCETDWSVVSTLASRFPWIVPSYGLHPWDCGNRSPGWLGALRTHLDADPRAAVGEIGLDRWILDGARPDDSRLAGLRRAPLGEQIEVFTAQLDLASRDNRAASIHCLQAIGALAETLANVQLPRRGFLLHAYAGPADMLQQFADLGAYFSFNGGALKHGAARLDVWKQIPSDRLLVETDAPAMRLPDTHEQFKLPATADGSLPNHPANIAAAYSALADLRETPLEKLTSQVAANFTRLFG